MNTLYYTIIHKIGSEDLVNYIYGLIYFEVDSEIVVNGTTVSAKAGRKIKIHVGQISLISGSVVLLGHPKPNSKTNFNNTTPPAVSNYLITDTGEIITSDDGSLFIYED